MTKKELARLVNEKLDIIKNAPYLFLDGLGNEKISKFTRDDIILSILELALLIYIGAYLTEKTHTAIAINTFINLFIKNVTIGKHSCFSI